jgi:subtilisin family serine protease
MELVKHRFAFVQLIQPVRIRQTKNLSLVPHGGRNDSLKYSYSFALTLLVASESYASVESIGDDGIASAGLTEFDGTTPLDGRGIAIGQVELDRPGKRVADGGNDSNANSNTNINPEAVFIRGVTGPTIANMRITNHAEQVAGVMISKDTTDPDGAVGPLSAPVGVAPAANLYSSAMNPDGPTYDAEAALAAQTIATQNGGDMRVINMSFGNSLIPGNKLDGNQLLTQFVDWSANHHDVLYVVAGNQGNMTPIPKDTFNGMVVARSTPVGGSGKYRMVSTGNVQSEDADGERRSVSLIAPGEDIDMASLNNAVLTSTGTSFAAPHVSGTAALLQQYGDERIRNSGSPRWAPTRDITESCGRGS